MDLAKLNTAHLDEAGAAFTPRSPLAPYEPLDITITLRSTNCTSVRARGDAFLRQLQTDRDFKRTGMLNADQLLEKQIEVLVACTVDWTGVELDGELLKCTAANARRVWSDPGLIWLRSQAQEFIAGVENFLPSSAPSSTPTLSAPSSSPVPSTAPTPAKAA
jgi:hypothetical protein